MKAAVLAIIVCCGIAAAEVVTTKTETIIGMITTVDSPYVCVQPDTGSLRVVRIADIKSIYVTDEGRIGTVRQLLPGVRVTHPDFGTPPDSTWLARHSVKPELRPGSIHAAGTSLRSAKSMFVASVVAGAVSSAISVSVLYYELGNPNRRVDPFISATIPLVLDVTSLVCAYLAWHNIGEAGDRLQTAAPASN